MLYTVGMLAWETCTFIFFTFVSQLGKYPNGGFYSGRKLSAFTVVGE
jgi:hypothetical protein